MTVACCDYIGVAADGSKEAVNRQRAANQGIIKVKSASVGIDWRMIRAAKEKHVLDVEPLYTVGGK